MTINDAENNLLGLREKIDGSLFERILADMQDEGFYYNAQQTELDDNDDLYFYFLLLFLYARVSIYNTVSRSYGTSTIGFYGELRPQQAADEIIKKLETGTPFGTPLIPLGNPEVVRALKQKLKKDFREGYIDILREFDELRIEALKRGVSFKEWLGTVKSGDISEAIQLNGKYKGIWEYNTTRIYSAGEQLETHRLRQYITYAIYKTMRDSRVTPLCKSLEGVIKPISEWDRAGLRPPNHYYCRSALVIIPNVYAQRYNISPSPFDIFNVKLPQEEFRGGFIDKFYL